MVLFEVFVTGQGGLSELYGHEQSADDGFSAPSGVIAHVQSLETRDFGTCQAFDHLVDPYQVLILAVAP